MLRAAEGIFSRLYGIDISENILKPLVSADTLPICADAQNFPFKDKSVDVVILFATIHHFYDYRPVLNEVYRVLSPGGIIYIDHDMNRYFYQNFAPFIKVYRKLFRKRGILRNSKLQNLYNLSECHSEGIDPDTLRNYLVNLGFEIKESFLGVSPCQYPYLSFSIHLGFGKVNLLVRYSSASKGKNPSIRVWVSMVT